MLDVNLVAILTICKRLHVNHKQLMKCWNCNSNSLSSAARLESVVGFICQHKKDVLSHRFLQTPRRSILKNLDFNFYRADKSSQHSEVIPESEKSLGR